MLDPTGPLPPGPWTGQTRDIVATILNCLYRKGESIRDLATATGRSYSTIHWLLSQYGTDFRPGTRRSAKWRRTRRT